MSQGHPWRRRWYRLRYGTLELIRSLPLVVGGLIVLALVLTAIAAPFISPRSPFEKKGWGQIGEDWIPPYRPSSVYPLGSDSQGRDILSLLIHGSQQTLLLAFVVMLARLAVGCLVGGLAAWKEGRPADRILMALSTAFSSFPALILAALLVLAFGVQGSLVSFTLALCFVGWGEIAQFVRSQVLVIRRKEYIESARATGLRETAIALRHVLPNLLPQLAALMSLEMAAVLLILGELGFLNIFYGGSTWTTYEVVGGERIFTTFEVPEWGAMLATSRQFIRNRSWVAFYPALAFFIASTGFSLTGLGLRRLADRGMLNLRLFFNRYVAAGLAFLVVASYLVMNNTGPLGTLIRFSRRADGRVAQTHAERLSAPELDGRRAGTPGADAAADYLGAELQALGLQPAGEEGSYFQTFTVPVVDLAETPTFVRWDASGTPHAYRHRVDFREVVRDVSYVDTAENPSQAGSGSAERAEVVFMPHRPVHVIVESGAYHWPEWPERILYGESARGRVIMTTWGPNLDYLVQDGLQAGIQGILLVAEDDGLVARRDTFPLEVTRGSLPLLLITRQAAEELVAGSGYTLQELEAQQGGSYPLGVRVSLSVRLVDRGRAETRNVLALYPGTESDARNAVILAAHYDGLGRDPDGTLFPGANEGASGCGVLLAVAQWWRDQGFVPQHPVLFAFWSGHEENLAGARAYLGYPYLPLPKPAIEHYVAEPTGILQVDYVGRGKGSRLALAEFLAGHPTRSRAGVQPGQEMGRLLAGYVDTATGNRLNRLARSTARLLWLNLAREALYTTVTEHTLSSPMSHRPFIEASMPAGLLRRPVAPADIRTRGDTPDRLSVAKLRQAARLVGLLGMRLANGR